MNKVYGILKKLKLVSRIGFSNKINFIVNILENKLQKHKLSARPIILDIVPTKACNLDCIFCIKYGSHDVQELSLENFKTIAEKLFPYAFFVDFCSGGEPFLNKNFMEFLAICRKYKVLVSIVSNGTFLSEAICRKIINNDCIAKFSFSFDGIKKQTVETIRRGLNYQRVIDNMRLMADLKKNDKSKHLLLRIRCTVMRRNIEELPDLIKYASEIGIDEVEVNYLNVANEIDRNESLFYWAALTKSIFKEAEKTARERKISLKLPVSKVQRALDVCDKPWQFIMIDPDGSVRFCYKSWDNAIGNIFEQEDFRALWNGERYQLIRKTVNTNKPYFKYCSVCSVRNACEEENSHMQYLHKDLCVFNGTHPTIRDKNIAC